MTPDYALASAYVTAIAGADSAVMEWRAIHDTDKGVPAVPIRGTLADHWQTLCAWNAAGYGIFAVPNSMNGAGRKLEHVDAIRAAYVDLDNLSARQNLERAAQWQPAPAFYVQTSAQKYHVYWTVAPYVGNDRSQIIARKLRQLFDGDRIIDATRVMRVPGFIHRKDPTNPWLVTCGALAGYGVRHDVTTLEAALASVNVIDGGHGERKPLGDTELAAPSLDWVRQALSMLDPNELDRATWIAITAAVKQSGWTFGGDAVRAVWEEWCARYTANDPRENEKQWNDITDTQLGWKSLVGRIPSLKAQFLLGGERHSVPDHTPAPGETAPVMPMPEPPPLDCSGEYLTDIEQREWFKGCMFVVNQNVMLTPSNRFLNASAFNVEYGGKYFIIDSNAKKTNEAWQAATRSTLWTVPKVDHIRFLPTKPYGEIMTDDLGRRGVNTYRPVIPTAVPGDVAPFLNHLAALLPDETDRAIVLAYLAHNVRFPGHKIPWAPVIQSAEGAGKGVLKAIVTHCMGASYTYFPNARELAESGAKFNAWMRNKLFILADEIKVDDRRDMIEVLKPMISEERIEMQGKGENQGIEDNFANWLFFTNWRNAIPTTKNARRFSVFFSPLQSADDLKRAGMDDAYFSRLYGWLNSIGAPIVAHYLLNYPIERGAIPMRAPVTSSTAEAVKISRGPIDRMIVDAVEDGLPGFRGGWVSVAAVLVRMKEVGIRSVQASTVETILTEMGYVARGRALRAYLNEDRATRSYLFHLDGSADVAGYGVAQGYAE